jgi:glycosyltransferase involved in cell wall biosynthesis
LEGERCGIGNPSQYAVIPELVNLEPHDQDFDAARVRARIALGLAGFDGPTIGWVGRFVPQKDPKMLGEAVRLVLADLPEAHAVLIGDGPGRREVEQCVADAGIAEQVHFAGLRPDVRELYAAMDVVIHPSLWEGQPRVVQEALAERVPVVATRVAGVPDLIQDGANGYVVAPRDAQGMAGATLRVLRTPALRPPLDAGALAPLHAVAGASRCVEQHHELYARLLAAPS